MISGRQVRKILVLFDEEERNFLTAFKQIISKETGEGFATFTLSASPIQSTKHLLAVSESFDGVIVTSGKAAIIIANESSEVMRLPDKQRKKITQNDAAGSLYHGKIVITNPLFHLFKVPEAPFLFKRYISKVTRPHEWIKFPKFQWQRAETGDLSEELRFLSESFLVSVDIETREDGLRIQCIAFSGISPDKKEIRTYVHDLRDPDFFDSIRRVLSLSVSKTFQNGLYDVGYLIRWGCVFDNWTHDTAYFFHSWFAELPKDLGFQGGFFIRDFEFWKSEAKNASNLEEYHRYNAKDAYATLCIAIVQLVEAPDWARKNFQQNFHNVFPCCFANLHGVSVDAQLRTKIKIAAEEQLATKRALLETLTSVKGINANSPKQIQTFLGLFGFHDSGTDESVLTKIADKHPILERIIAVILDIRGLVKAIGTYYESELLAGRLLFALDPSGTDSGRLACRSSIFWCGNQIQNQPPYAKQFLCADPDFDLVEIDNEQSETRCTAYLYQDRKLIEAVECGRDFHTNNIELFFGIPYEDALASVKADKIAGIEPILRQLAKKINHGASYNMGAAVFLETAGPRVIRMARSNLRLPNAWTNLQVAEFLLSLFHKAYPEIKSVGYKSVIKEIGFNNRLTGPTDWTRYFFSQPSSSKRALNMAVAHGPQSLSVMIINMGMRRFFREVQIPHFENVRFIAQIHDSLFFQVRKTHHHLIPLVEACMQNPIEVHGRILRIPTATKICGAYWAKPQKAA